MNTNCNYLLQNRLRHSIRHWLLFFIIALAISGLTALGVETQMQLLSPFLPSESTAVGAWLWKVYRAIQQTNQQYPFIAYGFDWLAFAHIVIATAFIGPLQNPVRNKWILQWGQLACCLVIPFALFAGAYRSLPLWWRCIDCSFGIIGFIPLTICLKQISRLEQLKKTHLARQIIFSTIQNTTAHEPVLNEA